MYVLSCSVVFGSLKPMDCSHQAPLSMGFSRQGYWRGLPCPQCNPQKMALLFFSQTKEKFEWNWICHWVPSSPWLEHFYFSKEGMDIILILDWDWLLGFRWGLPFPNLEKEMATHSSILAWKMPWTEEPGGYSPWGHNELDTIDWLTHTELHIDGIIK